MPLHLQSLCGVIVFTAKLSSTLRDQKKMMRGEPNRIDPDKWRPLIMSFQNFYGLGPQIHDSTLAEIPEAMYRSPDVDLARQAALSREALEA